MLRIISTLALVGALVTLTGCNTASGIGRDLSMLGEGLAAAPSWGEGIGSTIAEEDRQMAQLPWPVEPAGVQPQFSTQADRLVVTEPFYSTVQQGPQDQGGSQYQVRFEQESYGTGYSGRYSDQSSQYSAEQYYRAYQLYHQR